VPVPAAWTQSGINNPIDPKTIENVFFIASNRRINPPHPSVFAGRGGQLIYGFYPGFLKKSTGDFARF